MTAANCGAIGMTGITQLHGMNEELRREYRDLNRDRRDLCWDRR